MTAPDLGHQVVTNFGLELPLLFKVHKFGQLVGCWHGYLSVARCIFAYGSADVTATGSLSLALVKSRFVLVPAHPGNPRQSPEGRKTDVCVWVSIRALEGKGLSY